MENREVGSKIGLILFSIFLFILLIVPVSAITLHPEDAELDTSIVVTQTNPIAMFFRELKLSLLSIGARVAGGEYKASFTTEEAVYLEGDSIAWNTDCSNTYMVIELYKKTGSCPSGWTKTGLDCYIAKRSSSWSQVGLPPSQYSEDKFYHRWSANFGKLPEGDYEAVNYIYCGSTSSCISIECQTPNVADFSVKEEGSDCKEEFVGGRQCRATYSGHEDVYRRKQFEDCHEEYVLVETCPVCDGCYCNAGQCIGGGTPTCDNDGKCESGENAGNCPNDCGGTGPYCGDGTCGGGETYVICPADCQEHPDIVAENVQIAVKGNDIIVDLDLKNQGSKSMVQANIIEMQPRLPGQEPLTFISTQVTCDSSHPENVHYFYNIDANDKIHIQLKSEVENGTYNVFLMTRSLCYDNAPSEWNIHIDGNYDSYMRQKPFPESHQIPNVVVGEGDWNDIVTVCNNNGKCESGENAGNCPNDCGGGGDDSYLWYIIIFGVIILLIGGYFYFRDNG